MLKLADHFVKTRSTRFTGYFEPITNDMTRQQTL